MASLYRFGFEGGYVPNGVTFSGSYMLSQGRSGASSTAVSSITPVEAFVVAANHQSSNEIFATEFVKISSFGGGGETTLFSFGPVVISYSALSMAFFVRSNGVLLASYGYNLPTNVFIPFSYRVKLASVGGVVEFIIEGAANTFVGDTLQGSANSHPTEILFGLGAVNLFNSVFTIDDIAINNTMSGGSWGTENVSYPNFVRGQRSLIQSTGSVFQWFNGNSYATTSLIDIVNGLDTSSYIQAGQYNKIAQFKPTPVSVDSVVTFEGLNVFVDGATTIDSKTPVYFETYLQNGDITFNRADNSIVTTVPQMLPYGAYEQDIGGTINASDFNNGLINIVTRRFINQNLFGLGTNGDVVITGSTQLTSSGDYAFLDCENLTITSGSVLTTATPCKALVLYVKENLLVEGTISMTDKGMSGSLSDSPLVVLKNSSSLFDYLTASLSSSPTWIVEQQNQPTSIYSTDFGLNTFVSQGQSGSVGGGGRGGSSSLANAGNGGTSSFWAGGLGGGGALESTIGHDAGDFATFSGSSVTNVSGSSGAGAQTSGGSIYIFVGKHFLVNGNIVSNGTNGGDATGSLQAGGGGGSGGGSINLFYGLGFYNLGGTISATGGQGGLGINGGENGHAGGSGTVRITKLLTT